MSSDRKGSEKTNNALMIKDTAIMAEGEIFTFFFCSRKTTETSSMVIKAEMPVISGILRLCP